MLTWQFWNWFKHNNFYIHVVDKHKGSSTQAGIVCRIKENRDFLLEELEPRDFTQHLIDKGLFSNKDEGKTILSGEMPRRERVKIFLDRIVEAEGQTADHFVKLLKDHGLMHIVRKLGLEHIHDIDIHAEAGKEQILHYEYTKSNYTLSIQICI